MFDLKANFLIKHLADFKYQTYYFEHIEVVYF